MPLYKNVSDSAYYKGGRGGKVKPGETVKFEDGPPETFADEFEAVSGSESDSSPEPTETSDGEGEAAENGEEPAQNEAEGEVEDPPLDPTEYTNEQLRSELNAGDFSEEELEVMLEVEQEGPNRKGATEAIEEAM